MRKVKDFFYYKAKKDKYPARSVYKLEEMDKKYNIIKKGARVLDLGCSPGSWSKYCSSKVGHKGLVAGIDKEKPKVESLPNMEFLQQDILKLDLNQLKQISPQFDVVLSDLAPSTTGTKEVDQARSLELALAAYDIAVKMLKPGGHFVCKLFQGPDVNKLFKEMRRRFTWTKTAKPSGSRRESFEVYVVGYGKK